MSIQANDLGMEERLRRRKLRDNRSQSLGTKLTRAEEREVVAVAREQGKPAGEWMREVLLREARRSKTDPILTEIIANRMLLINVLRPLIAGQKMSGERFDELLTAIKAGKRNAAQEVLEQYAVELPQEATDGE